jgi:hypothetical protein
MMIWTAQGNDITEVKRGPTCSLAVGNKKCIHYLAGKQPPRGWRREDNIKMKLEWNDLGLCPVSGFDASSAERPGFVCQFMVDGM